jgi:hypothetical protein
MGSIPLPIDDSFDTEDYAFRITQPSSGGVAILGRSFGTDRFGDQPTGVQGEADSGGVGVLGTSDSGPGVQGVSPHGPGVNGQSYSSDGVYGQSGSSHGVYGESQNFDGVKGISHSPSHAGVAAQNDSSLVGSGDGNFGLWAVSSNGVGVYGQGTPAGYFNGDVRVTGDVILVNADCAEDFDVADDALTVEPGTVLTINEQGELTTAAVPYDSRLAGIVSGAGDLRPAIVLHRIVARKRRVPVALLGKVGCKVDASYASVGAGDLLTTSATPGYAMKAVSRRRAVGAILGKALTDLKTGQGIIPVLVCLH